jgi:hypothetical protein
MKIEGTQEKMWIMEGAQEGRGGGNVDNRKCAGGNVDNGKRAGGNVNTRKHGRGNVDNKSS